MKSVIDSKYIDVYSPVASGEQYFVYHMENTFITKEAHRLAHYAVCLVSNGEMKVETNLFFHHAIGPSVYVIAPGVIRRFLETEKVQKGTVIFFDKDFFLNPTCLKKDTP